MTSPDLTQSRVFLLTGESQDPSGRGILRFYGRAQDGQAVEIQVQNNRPVFFVERKAALPSLPPCERSQVSLQTFARKPVDALYFNNQNDFFRARDLLRQNNIATYESDIYPSDRYLMERFIHGQADVTGAAKKENGVLRFVNPRLKPAFIDPKFRVASIDIETGVRNNLLYSVAVHLTGPELDRKRIFMLTSPDPAVPDRDFEEGTLTFYSNEKELLKDFLKWFAEEDPDLILGWNVVGFDLLYLQEKCAKLNVPFTLGRSGRQASVRKRSSGGYYPVVPGRVVFDGPVALRSSFYSFEDFSLETVAQEILGEGKKISKEVSKIEEIERMFQHDQTALAGYNLQDCVLVTKIFEKTGLIDLFVKRSQISGLLMEQTGMSTAAFDHFYLPRLHRRGFVAPNVADINLMEHAAGGYVIPPKTGLYDHVLVLDFKSLYPSIIRTFSIDPLSRLLAEEDPDAAVTPKGFRFSRKEAILPEFIRELMELRAQAVTKKDGHLSQAIKILMNSFYGVMGSAGCRFYHPDLPTAITSTGQWLLMGSRNFLEENGYEVLYGDTDSLFVRCISVPLGNPDEHGKKLAATVTEHWQKELKKQFNVTSYLEVKYEKYYRKFLLPLARSGEGGAKKRYSGLKVSGGKETLEFTGMEFVRSDWTKLAKEFQHGLYQRIFHDEDPSAWIKALAEEVRSGKLDEKLIYQKRLRKDLEEYTKAVPPHVKAALLLERPGRSIKYVITKRGPIPAEMDPKDIDYAHYIDKQMKPIAESILGLLGKSFDTVSRPAQFSLFENF